MTERIEDYGLIGNTYSAALVSRGGSIDWLCLPRFDSESVFGALLGDRTHGRWLIAPEDPTAQSSRSYRGNSGILDTRFETEGGSVVVTDFMPLHDSEDQVELIRLVRGERGRLRPPDSPARPPDRPAARGEAVAANDRARRCVISMEAPGLVGGAVPWRNGSRITG